MNIEALKSAVIDAINYNGKAIENDGILMSDISPSSVAWFNSSAMMMYNTAAKLEKMRQVV